MFTIYQPNARAVPFKNTKPEVLKHGPSLRDPCVKHDGLVFHGTARAIRLINNLLHGKNELLFRTFTKNSPTIFRIFSQEISSKSFPQDFC